MDNEKISSTVLAKGISKDDFVKILGDIKGVVEEGSIALNNYNLVADELRGNGSTPDVDEWINNFIRQVDDSNNIVNDEFKKIEDMFNRIFKDWDEYQKINISNTEEAEHE